jgi:hypothetical protein
VRAGLTLPPRSAGQDPAVFLAAGVDRAERRRGQGDEDARVVRDSGGDALAAGEPGADELVGVSAVDLGAGRAAGGAAGLAGDGQDAAGLVDGGVAVDQFAGAAVDVVGATAQQNRLQAPSGVPDGTCGDRGGQRRYSSRRAGERRHAPARQTRVGFADQRCCAACWAWSGVACRSGVSCGGVCTAAGYPVTHRSGIYTVIPRWGEASRPHTYSTHGTCLIHKVSD